MKKLLVAASLVAAGLLSHSAQAQAPSFPSDEPAGQANGKTTRKRKASSTDIANMQRRMNMNPEDAKRDQQLELLQARAGGSANTSFGRASGPARQYEKGNGGFTVRKYKASKHTKNAMMKKGQSRPAMGIDPKGKPLNHKRKKHFLFF
ncbi:hypothetical protein MTX78_20265 [Hymenobacter tibetensis]|uniref:DUF4890 domain-containing protein n=1 Tax=Hymenobacter tibetensis TaxID=497967 RepID=A0ABY4CXF9_9BACT|nr:hypothetical protein [Hymenobacter tibetensis]UOG74442.1 hypothetical protein MTX78_20265 [Hymenobacter tibetensis]